MEVYLPVILMLLGLFLGLPVFPSIFLAVLIYFPLAGNPRAAIGVQRLIGAAENSVILAVPFFIMVGSLMNYTGITRRMLNLADVLSGRLAGGLAQTNILLSTLMGGISASNLADCAMTCKVLAPEMERRGFSREYSAAVTAASSLITPIIPPGIALIIYGYVADVSIGRMFMAGIIPGLSIFLAMAVATHIISRRRGYKPSRAAWPTLGELAAAVWNALPGLSLVLVIIGGIRLGVFTPTEAGAAAVVFIIAIGTLVYREMRLEHLYYALVDCARSTASIMLVIMACSAFSWILSWEQVTLHITRYITGVTDDPRVFLAALNIFLLICGMFMEGNALLIVLVPILKPTAVAMNIDLVQFGIIFIINLAIGTLTPPIGTVTLLAVNLTNSRMGPFLKELLPYLGCLLLVLLLCTYWPAYVAWFPDLAQ
ncbi:MAG: TRAP transporter large permease [Planctomycetota bacterium]|jgi:tripartite ATP-independent transporter DctM subunit|nr:TRAP transporter large permease [Planctomycetota bacterium]